MHYSSGVFNVTGCGPNDDIDHAVMLVGYDTTGEKPYFILRNSWGTGWGQDGYMQIAITSGPGVCNINQFPVYPLVGSTTPTPAQTSTSTSTLALEKDLSVK